ncbi:OmpA/MotB domain-containing protein [Actibacterium atlanticum]|uniref:OmpA/MotB domain-containing protein n=2 Tax=Actibacterium atlanticum TaxID=1461693 RepID=A0A058ZL36_9RHOB|nr:OmpA/MotB domain-containing protein [Actibacterium atlanticum]
MTTLLTSARQLPTETALSFVERTKNTCVPEKSWPMTPSTLYQSGAMLRSLCISLSLMALPLAASAQLLEFPAGAERTADSVQQLSSYRLPIGPFENDTVQTIWAEGEIARQAWQIQIEGATTLQLLAPLRDQLTAEGFEILFECEAENCGGFDFRYATEVLPEPEMHVDLGDYRFLSAHRMGEAAPEYISLMVSRSSLRGFVQVTRVGPELGLDAALSAASTKNPASPIGTGAFEGLPLSEQLQLSGRAILGDLAFETGSSKLGVDQFGSLADLAGFLSDHPEITIALVGHTDAEGGLDGNIALSKKRAQSVMKRLVDVYSIPAAQISAEGVGFLAPVASNQTDDGRTQNRRVEVIITSTQ